MAISRVDLRFALTRALTLSDFVALRDKLVAQGHTASLLRQGGIDLTAPGGEGRKDLRFSGLGNVLSDMGGMLDRDTLEFVGSLQMVVAECPPGVPTFGDARTIRASLKYGVSLSECLSVIACVSACLVHV